MNTFGKNIRFSIFGESHGKCIGITIDGLPSGLTLNTKRIDEMLILRQGLPEISTPRKEDNPYDIVSGYFDGFTTGAPLTIIVPNKNYDDSVYKEHGLIRPSHADLPLYIKYDGKNDYLGGGHSSGRVTVVLIILGVICDQLLEQRGILVSSHLSSVKDVHDKKLKKNDITFENFKQLKSDPFPVFDQKAKQQMINVIKKAKKLEDAVGGTVETFILGLPAGLGEPFFDTFESVISHAMFAIPGVKALEFGDGFEMCDKYASEIVDQLHYYKKELQFKSNHQGGINGGITNGNYISFKTGVRAPSSIVKPLNSVNYKNKENVIVSSVGRHDPAIVHRVLPVINALTSFVVLDFIKETAGFNNLK